LKVDVTAFRAACARTAGAHTGATLDQMFATREIQRLSATSAAIPRGVGAANRHSVDDGSVTPGHAQIAPATSEVDTFSPFQRRCANAIDK